MKAPDADAITEQRPVKARAINMPPERMMQGPSSGPYKTRVLNLNSINLIKQRKNIVHIEDLAEEQRGGAASHVRLENESQNYGSTERVPFLINSRQISSTFSTFYTCVMSFFVFVFSVQLDEGLYILNYILKYLRYSFSRISLKG